MSSLETKKLRLSIENARVRTRQCLEKKLSEAKNAPSELMRVVYKSVTSDLLNGIHVLTDTGTDNCSTIRNLYIVSLAIEFPDLVLKEKK